MKITKYLIIGLIWLFISKVHSQEVVPETNKKWEDLKHTWKAAWIKHPTEPLSEYGVYHFRKTFELKEKPEKFIIHVSADNRYRLMVNGKSICEGPARGDLMNWRYETVDISDYLKKGENVLAAMVINFGEYRQASQFTRQTAFILQAELEKNYYVNTNDSWMVIKNDAYHPLKVSGNRVHGFYVVGPADSIDASLYPWGWEKAKFEHKNLFNAKGNLLNRGVGRGFIHGTPWSLVKSKIPLLEKKIERIPKIVRYSGIVPHEGFLKGDKELIVKANSKVTILVDRTHLTIGYPEMIISNGKGSKIKIEYAEALFDKSGKKGNRNIIKNKNIEGVFDIFMPDGGNRRLYRPLWLRTFRYVQFEITTNSEPLIIHDFYNIFTAYPFKQNAKIKFEPDTSRVKEIWETGWRTARLCAGETYYDTPFYEQLQYIGDTRIQALISLYISGDDRLMKNALKQFNNSIFPEGLTMCRAPTDLQQVIPTFSLYWIAMIHDYYMHRSDPEFLKQFLTGMRSVLAWYEYKIDDTKMLGPLEWWNFVDWANGFPNGIPKGADNGNSALISLTYVYALERASEIFSSYNYKYEAERYLKQAQSIKKAVYNKCFDTSKQMFGDTPEKTQFSQHTNAMAILTDALPINEQSKLMEKVLYDNSLIQASLYFKFYVMRALNKSGLGDKYMSLLEPWKAMLDLGLTTFPETEPNLKSMVSSRSDCHAWSASPNYDFLATVCGISPKEKGFKFVEIKPHFGHLQKITGSMPHPNGTISVSLERNNASGVKGIIEMPEGISGSFIWNQKEIKLVGGKQEINL